MAKKKKEGSKSKNQNIKNQGKLEALTEPFKIKFNFQDILQIIVGSFVLAVPVGFTQEVWQMAETLPWLNMVAIIVLTLFFISIFTYYSYHREHINARPKYHVVELSKRVLTTYAISFVIVAILMTAIGVTPWQTNLEMAINIVVLVTFPASIGAVISDRIK